MNPVSNDTLPLLSFIIGMGISIMLFHKPFQMRPTLSLPLEEIHGKVFSQSGKCYKYVAEDSECEILSSR